MISEKKLSIFRPVYVNVSSDWGAWLSRATNGDLRYKGESIFTHVHTLIWFLGFGIAWGFDHDEEGNHYIQQEHVMKWDHCEYRCVASRIWYGRMEIFT